MKIKKIDGFCAVHVHNKEEKIALVGENVMLYNFPLWIRLDDGKFHGWMPECECKVSGEEYYKNQDIPLFEFSELIIQEELSAVEVVKWLIAGCMDDRFYDYFNPKANADINYVFDHYTSEEIVDIISKAKKESEFKLIWEYRVFSSDGHSEDKVTEDAAILRCEEIAKEGKSAWYSRICRKEKLS